MTNKAIIEAIKSNDPNGIIKLANKYSITVECAERIAESIRKHNAYSLRKTDYKYDREWINIFIGWRGRGYLGEYTTSTYVHFNVNDGRFFVYGDL